MMQLIVTLKMEKLKLKKIIFATNGFLKSLGIKSNYNFPITLTASMTRTLTEEEFKIYWSTKRMGCFTCKTDGCNY